MKKVQLKPHVLKTLLTFQELFKERGVFPSGFDVVERTGLKPLQVDRAITVLLRKGLIKQNRH